MILGVFAALLIPHTVYAAPSWPSEISIQAEGGILMDADSSCVLYGKNIHETFYPASITKILTALIVIENCDLDDTLTFSYEAVHNVEPGSTSAGYDTGDQITVRQALYAMLLKSANEVANALAEHCAGSIEAFAEMMNEKAASLGCTDSHFANPSGLNDENHYTSPYDFALISKAAFENPTFVEIDSTTYYELPPNATNTEPFMVYAGHKMLKKSSGMHYDGIIGGKTGYTLSAGNTLVTCAERDGLKLITVILNGHQTHYSDTEALLDFGFANFKNVRIGDYDTRFTNPEADIDLTGSRSPLLTIDGDQTATLPKDASLEDADAQISYDLPADAPEGAAAQITYTYEDHVIGTTYLMGSSEVSVMQEGQTAGGTAGSGAAAANGGTAAGRGNGTSGSDAGSGNGSSVGTILAAALILLLIIGAAFLIVRRFAQNRDTAQRGLSETLKRYTNEDHATGNTGLYTDLSSSVNHYYKDTKPRSRRRTHRHFFERKS